MSTELLEEKVVELAKRVAALETKIRHASPGGWQDIIGWEKDDELFREAVRLGAEWRAQANAEGR